MVRKSYCTYYIDSVRRSYCCDQNKPLLHIATVIDRGDYCTAVWLLQYCETIAPKSSDASSIVLCRLPPLASSPPARAQGNLGTSRGHSGPPTERAGRPAGRGDVGEGSNRTAGTVKLQRSGGAAARGTSGGRGRQSEAIVLLVIVLGMAVFFFPHRVFASVELE